MDSSGSFTGQPVTPQWSDIQSVPSGFSDGVDDDSQLSQSEVVNYVVQSGVDLHADTTIGGQNIQTGEELDSLADISW